MKTRVAIIGGGLSGMFAARLLAAAGIDFRLFEARARLGGRILGAFSDEAEPDGLGDLDLGPSWFWPAMQPMMSALVKELGLASFAQFADGDVIIERFSREAPQRYQGYRQEPTSFRIAGGTSALIAALADRLPVDHVERGVCVTKAELRSGGVTLHAQMANGDSRQIEAEHILFALPPRLLAASFVFDPPVSPDVAARWANTPTWMAPHAKFVAVYDTPFWRTSGLSGTAQSMVGPLAEIHDASTQAGVPALFGFLGVSPAARDGQGAALVDACVQHLTRLFGPDAGSPVATHLKDWSTDIFTATADDRLGGGGHPSASNKPWVDQQWTGRIILSGSETAVGHPGYLEGALEAADAAVVELGVILSRDVPVPDPVKGICHADG